MGAVRFGRYFYRWGFLVCCHAIDLRSCVKQRLPRGICVIGLVMLALFNFNVFWGRVELVVR